MKTEVARPGRPGVVPCDGTTQCIRPLAPVADGLVTGRGAGATGGGAGLRPYRLVQVLYSYASSSYFLRIQTGSDPGQN